MPPSLKRNRHLYRSYDIWQDLGAYNQHIHRQCNIVPEHVLKPFMLKEPQGSCTILQKYLRREHFKENVSVRNVITIQLTRLSSLSLFYCKKKPNGILGNL